MIPSLFFHMSEHTIACLFRGVKVLFYSPTPRAPSVAFNFSSTTADFLAFYQELLILTIKIGKRRSFNVLNKFQIKVDGNTESFSRSFAFDEEIDINCISEEETTNVTYV